MTQSQLRGTLARIASLLFRWKGCKSDLSASDDTNTNVWASSFQNENLKMIKCILINAFGKFGITAVHMLELGSDSAHIHINSNATSFPNEFFLHCFQLIKSIRGCSMLLYRAFSWKRTPKTMRDHYILSMWIWYTRCSGITSYKIVVSIELIWISRCSYFTSNLEITGVHFAPEKFTSGNHPHAESGWLRKKITIPKAAFWHHLSDGTWDSSTSPIYPRSGRLKKNRSGSPRSPLLWFRTVTSIQTTSFSCYWNRGCDEHRKMTLDVLSFSTKYWLTLILSFNGKFVG